MRLFLILGLAVYPFVGTTTAQAQYDSRQEQQFQNLNRSIGQQQRRQQQLQQNQFEMNQMKQDLQRNQLFTRPPISPGPGLYRR